MSRRPITAPDRAGNREAKAAANTEAMPARVCA
jgi:hypothetical protein